MQPNSNHRSTADFATQQFLFDRVVKAYAEIAELPLLSAVNYDPDASRRRILTHDALNYKADVESGTTAALEGFPALQFAWFQLAAGDKVPARVSQAVIKRCAPIYAKRRLDPNRYFLKFRQTLPWERRIA